MKFIQQSFLILASLFMVLQLYYLAAPIMPALFAVIFGALLIHNFDCDCLSSPIFNFSLAILATNGSTSLISSAFGFGLASFYPHGLTFLCMCCFGSPSMTSFSAAMACLSLFMPLQAQALTNPISRYSAKAVLSYAIVLMASARCNNDGYGTAHPEDYNPFLNLTQR
tara:strand:+ start:109 stop:612 length:504 start_codon:yes stop_codon:yes gene_type:complete